MKDTQKSKEISKSIEIISKISNEHIFDFYYLFIFQLEQSIHCILFTTKHQLWTKLILLSIVKFQQ